MVELGIALVVLVSAAVRNVALSRCVGGGVRGYGRCPGSGSGNNERPVTKQYVVGLTSPSCWKICW